MTRANRRPHLLGIDDGPFEKGSSQPVTCVAVLMEGADLIEAVAQRSFPVDGADATAFLAEWITSLRSRPALDAVLLGGITLAGLGVVDVPALSASLDLPVLVVTRKDPSAHRLGKALGAAGLEDRMDLVRRAPGAVRLAPARRYGRLYVACAGTTQEHAHALVEASRRKSALPEPLRVAHLVAAAIARGESRGRA